MINDFDKEKFLFQSNLTFCIKDFDAGGLQMPKEMTQKQKSLALCLSPSLSFLCFSLSLQLYICKICYWFLRCKTNRTCFCCCCKKSILIAIFQFILLLCHFLASISLITKRPFNFLSFISCIHTRTHTLSQLAWN